MNVRVLSLHLPRAGGSRESAGSAAAPSTLVVRFDRYAVDVRGYELRRDGEVVGLPPRAFDLLVHLLRSRERVVSKAELLRELWPNTVVTKDCLPHAVMALRRALGEGARFIATVRGRGYRFVGDVELPSESRAPSSHAREATAVAVLRAASVELAVGNHRAALDIMTSGLRALSSDDLGPD